MVATMALIGLSCDTYGLETEPELRSTRLRRDCAPPVYSPDEFAMRFVNLSGYKIDSVDVSISTIPGHDRWFSGTFPVVTDKRSQCYAVMPKTYKSVHGGIREYRSLFPHFSPESIYIDYPASGYPSSVIFKVKLASGKYSYIFDIERFKEIYFRSIALKREDLEGSAILLRVVNDSPTDFREIKYDLRGGMIEIPFLAAGDSTDYFEITPTNAHNPISLIAGQDTVARGPVDHLPGAGNIRIGHYVSRLDTVQVVVHREIAEIVSDGS